MSWPEGSPHVTLDLLVSIFVLLSLALLFCVSLVFFACFGFGCFSFFALF